MEKKKIKYSNILYGFDIETTTTENVFTHNGEKITAHYLSNFQSVDFSARRQPVNEIVNLISAPFFCRSAYDINKYLICLNDYAALNDETIIIYVHNLAYEFDYLIKNIPFIIENFSNDNALFIKSRIPLFMRCKNIEFRCSFKLLNQSLAALGKQLKYPKLDIEYTTKYFEFSELPQIEYDYNERDVKLMLLAVLKECCNWEYIKTVDGIPLTSTGFTRKNNKHINTTEARREFSKHCHYQTFYDIDYINFLESVYSGGYTHANAFYVGKPLSNVASVDIISSYIDTILHRHYPNFFKEYKHKSKLNYFRAICRANKTTLNNVLKNYSQPFKIAFMAKIRLHNVSARILKNKNLILPLSVSKCEDIVNVTPDNGRIYKAEAVTIYCTEVDYFILTQFYDFEVTEVFKLMFTQTFKPLEDYIINSTRNYLTEKSTLKKILHDTSDGANADINFFYNDRINDYIYDVEKVEAIAALLYDEQQAVLTDNYRASKNKLNAQYGINVQKLLNAIIKYNVESFDFDVSTETTITSFALLRDFTKGLYITAYSRLNLFCFGLWLIRKTNTHLVYSDTDSWKCYKDITGVSRETINYNNFIETVVHNSNDYNVGKFDFEGVYTYFSTLGCKRYITANKNPKTGKTDITVTIAGVNKKRTSEAYTALFHRLQGDFSLLCDIAFTPSTVISSNVTNKLVSKYNNAEYDVIVTDCNGKTGRIVGRNMLELSKSDYILNDITKYSIREYIDYFSTLQGISPHYTPTYIYYEDGKITYKILTDLGELNIINSTNPYYDENTLKG